MGETPDGRSGVENRFWEWLSRTAVGLGYPTEAALARALDISPSTVFRWRTGSRPTIKHLLGISRTFGIKLEALLVLSGHAPADAVGDPKPPLPLEPVTPAERIILDADLDSHLEAIMQKYWESRILEERKRLEMLIELLMLDPVPLADESFSRQLSDILESRLPAHVSRAIVEWAQYRQSTP